MFVFNEIMPRVMMSDFALGSFILDRYSLVLPDTKLSVEGLFQGLKTWKCLEDIPCISLSEPVFDCLFSAGTVRALGQDRKVFALQIRSRLVVCSEGFQDQNDS